jgi:RNA polymerase sigma-70 factor (ECF subfamily)
VLVNGAPGFVVIRDGVPLAVAGFSVSGGRVVELDLLVDPQRLAELDLSAAGWPGP